VALGLLTPNLMGIGTPRTNIRIVPICGTPPSDFGLSFPRAGAVFLASSKSSRGYRPLLCDERNLRGSIDTRLPRTGHDLRTFQRLTATPLKL
jgi:hypothetical protein